MAQSNTMQQHSEKHDESNTDPIAGDHVPALATGVTTKPVQPLSDLSTLLETGYPASNVRND